MIFPKKYIKNSIFAGLVCRYEIIKIRLNIPVAKITVQNPKIMNSSIGIKNGMEG